MNPADKETARAVIQLTDSPGSESSFSHVPAKGAFSGLKELARTLLSLRGRGVELVEFAGGEPTLWPYLPQAVALAHKIGFKTISLTTNGRRLADAGYADALVRAGLDAAVFIIPSHRPAVYSGATGAGPAALGQALAGLRNIMRHEKVERGLILPVREALAGDLENTVKFFGGFGFSFITLAFDAPYDLLSGGAGRDLSEKYRLLPGVLAALPRMKRFGRIIAEGIQPCLLGRYGELVLNETFRNPGVLVRGGGAETAALPDAYTLLGIKTSACRGCRHSARCPGFFAGDAAHIPAAPAPHSAALDLQDGSCDYNCGFCRRNRDGVRYHALDPEKYFARPDRGLLHAFFSSSSAFSENLNVWGRDRTDMFPGIHAIIAQARECGFRRVTLWTTGLRLADKKQLAVFAKSGLTGFEIPLYGGTAAAHDSITASPGSFARVMRGLDALAAFGELRADFHTVALKRNADTLPDLVELLAGRCPGSRLNLWHYYSDEPSDPAVSRAYAANVPDYKTLIAAFSRLKKPLPLEVKTAMFPLCVARRLLGEPLPASYAARSFALLICNEHGALHKSVTNAEFGERHVRACRGCPAAADCAGVMEEYLKVHGEAGLRPVRR